MDKSRVAAKLIYLTIVACLLIVTDGYGKPSANSKVSKKSVPTQSPRVPTHANKRPQKSLKPTESRSFEGDKSSKRPSRPNKKSPRPPSDAELAAINEAVYSSDLKATVKPGCKNNEAKALWCMPKGYRRLIDFAPALTGKDADTFQAAAVLNKKTKDLVIVFRGTNDPQDWQANLQIAWSSTSLVGVKCVRNAVNKALRAKDCGVNSPACYDKKVSLSDIACGRILDKGRPGRLARYVANAEVFYIRAMAAAGNRAKRVSITGHSLGGYLATYVGAKFKKRTVTFNSAPGARYLLGANRRALAQTDAFAMNQMRNVRAKYDFVSPLLGLKPKVIAQAIVKPLSGALVLPESAAQLKAYGHTGRECVVEMSHPGNRYEKAHSITYLRQALAAAKQSCSAPPRTKFYW
ncbi:MAG: YqiA/YcfP family alpha/beta fold hydrolase [Bradymonadia bacterium]